ncbi:amidohydrolase family protein [Microlunatus flavus]|uniref:Predicted metal-dependent hydrolase, TIM-barrel fold n=1 Tax=Microlunatus flavus TaxID=1036181 RepID=A0A1H9ABK9_9ACTN|nr:amidohydrolase family protein [Microlunatus flavus]SEP73995.1 Predicted metal-dependent hydrolase, TIM-barrel fold [Microlunatus flavus]
MEEPDWDALQRMPLTAWHPRSQLRAPRTPVERTAVPAIDVHNHLGRWLTEGRWPDGPWMVPDPGALVADLDACGIDTVVNLDGMWGEEVTANVERYDAAYPGRFLTFCQLDWNRLAEPDGVAVLRRSLEESRERGARGVKVWKDLGLGVRDADGSLISPDDARVVEVLRHAGDLGLPVLIHTADPVAFFTPVDEHNERVEELAQHRDWWFGDPARFPTFDALLDAHAALVLACPQTRFVGAHVGGAAEDLDRVGRLLDAAPHYAVDIAGRMAELGRQPRRTARFVHEHPDQVLFGTDIFPTSAAAFRLHVRFLETADEAFAYDPAGAVPSQGRWTVSGLDLDPALLPALYRDNARRFLGLD